MTTKTSIYLFSRSPRSSQFRDFAANTNSTLYITGLSNGDFKILLNAAKDPKSIIPDLRCDCSQYFHLLGDSVYPSSGAKRY